MCHDARDFKRYLSYMMCTLFFLFLVPEKRPNEGSHVVLLELVPSYQSSKTETDAEKNGGSGITRGSHMLIINFQKTFTLSA